MGEAGVFNLCLAEEAGGVGLGLSEAALVFEELGRSLVPGPLVASHLASGLIDGADDGSAVVGLVEERRLTGGVDGGRGVPVVIEYLDDLDVLLVLSEEGRQRRRSPIGGGHPPPASDGPVDPGVVGGVTAGGEPRSPGRRSRPGGDGTGPS